MTSSHSSHSPHAFPVKSVYPLYFFFTLQYCLYKIFQRVCTNYSFGIHCPLLFSNQKEFSFKNQSKCNPQCNPLFFNMLSRFVIAFLLKSKYLLISCLQSPFAVILEPKKIRSPTASTFSHSICHEVMGPDIMLLVF